MKPQPAPPVPGNSEWERFDNAVGMLLNAPKGAFVRQEKKLRKRREKESREYLHAGRTAAELTARPGLTAAFEWLAK
jgi:hypothetical protein